MKAFDSSSLWRISQFRKARNEGRLDLERGGDRATLLPTAPLLADLRRLQSEGADGDVLEVSARRASAIARRRCCTSSRASSSGR